MLKLSIIGCGNVAKTMGFLWNQMRSMEIVDVVNRSQTSADNSVAFIGAGRPLGAINKLQDADIFAIGCGDDQLELCLLELLKQNVIHENTVVFHFSGAKNSTVLDSAKKHGAKCASLHPVKSFTDIALSTQTFTGTYCGLEGDESACAMLENQIAAIGGRCFKVDSDKKLTYHAASVFACNYMVALQELSLRAFEYSGVERDLATKILEPIVKETTENIFRLGSADSLTGPIARGDHELVAEQLMAVKGWNIEAGELYGLLGKLVVDLSDKKGASDTANLQKIKKLLK